MQRDQRLRRRKDFAAAYRKGRVQGNRLLVVRINPNEGDITRFGFVAGKVVGGAVIRNRVKRRLREAARSLDTKPGLDVVIGARKAAADHVDSVRQSLSDIEQEEQRLVRATLRLEGWT